MIRQTKVIMHWARDARESMAAQRPMYGIKKGYRHRIEGKYFDDTSLTDEWQKEVYLTAKDLADKKDLKTVYDVGCGSAYKLMKYLGHLSTTGFDIEPTLSFLREKYPNNNWQYVPFDNRDTPPADLVICSDVIEHVDNPDDLVGFLKHITGKYLIISTPTRELMYGKFNPRRSGPPINSSHIREWSFSELRDYIEPHFKIVEHKITNESQCTQMIVGGKKY